MTAITIILLLCATTTTLNTMLFVGADATAMDSKEAVRLQSGQHAPLTENEDTSTLCIENKQAKDALPSSNTTLAIKSAETTDKSPQNSIVCAKEVVNGEVDSQAQGHWVKAAIMIMAGIQCLMFLGMIGIYLHVSSTGQELSRDAHAWPVMADPRAMAAWCENQLMRERYGDSGLSVHHDQLHNGAGAEVQGDEDLRFSVSVPVLFPTTQISFACPHELDVATTVSSSVEENSPASWLETISDALTQSGLSTSNIHPDGPGVDAVQQITSHLSIAITVTARETQQTLTHIDDVMLRALTFGVSEGMPRTSKHASVMPLHLGGGLVGYRIKLKQQLDGEVDSYTATVRTFNQDMKAIAAASVCACIHGCERGYRRVRAYECVRLW